MLKMNSIKTKLVLPILAFVILAGLATGLVARQVMQESFDLALREKGTAIARQIAVTASNDLLLEDKNQLRDILKEQQASVPDLAYAFILDENNNIMAHTFDSGVPLQLLWENHLARGESMGIEMLEIDGEIIYDFAVPVNVASQYRIGTVRMGMSQGELDAALASLRTSSAIITVILILIGLMITYLLSTSIVNPIRRLHRVSELVAGGNYNTRVEPGRASGPFQSPSGAAEKAFKPEGDEIFQLGQAFNHMIDTVNEVTGQLRDSKDLLASILNTVPQCILWKDLNGVYLGCNQAFVDFSGLGNEAGVVGKTDFDLPVAPRQASAYQAEDARILEQGPMLHDIQAMMTANGDCRWVESSKIPMRDETGRNCMILSVFEDITARIAAQTELEEARLKVLRSEKLATIGQLASTIAHEIRNPLGVMKNVVYYLNMFDLGDFDAEVKENLDILSHEIDNSNKIVGDLLDFSRIRKPVLNPNNLNTIVEAALGRLKLDNGIKLIQELDPGLPIVEIDGVQIQQVFYNIAANAVQAMDKGGTLTVISRPQGDSVEVSFTDTGTGIAEKDLQSIFEPLFTTKAKGTGLGLALVASMVEGHQGRIDVSSRPGQGSTFTVILPVERRAS